MHVIAAKAVAFHLAAQPDFREYAAADRAQRGRARRRARRRGLPHRVRRHRQPPDARRPAAVRRDRQGRAGGARPGRDHLQQERDPERPREAVRHERPAPRHRRGHHRGHGRGRDGGDRGADRVGAAGPGRRRRSPGTRSTRPTGSARSTRRTPSSKPAGRERRTGGWLRGRLRGRGADDARCSPRSSASSRSGSARSSRRTRAACTRRRCRRSAARRCSSASSSRWRSRRRSRSSATMFDGSSEPAGLMLGAGVMFAVGALDDLRDVSPPAKLAGMVLAGSLLSLFGVSMLFFRVPFAGQDTVVLSPDLAPLVTVIVVVLFANAINLIDGLDGLAAGIVIIAGTALFLYSDRLFKDGFLEGDNIAPLVAVIAVGICVGFLPYNFNPARIFMGDAGALFLGLLLATTHDHDRRARRLPVPGHHLLLLRAAVHPDRDPRRADPRHRVLVRPTRGAGAVVRGRGQGPPAPPAHAPRPRPAPHRRDPLALDRAALGPRAAADLHDSREPQRARARSASSPSRSCSTPFFVPGLARAGPVRQRRRRSTRASRRPRSRPSSARWSISRRRRRSAR